MPDPGGNIYPFPGHGGPQFFVPLHTYINIPPWFSKQNSPSRLAAAGSTWLRTKYCPTSRRCPTPDWYISLSSTPPQGFRSTKTPTPTCVTTSGDLRPSGRRTRGLLHSYARRRRRHARTCQIDAHGVELTVPVTRGRLNLGTWQGIYLCEFRNRAPGRRIVATIIG